MMILNTCIEQVAKTQEVLQHPAWCGLITQTTAEKMLKNQHPLTYILRQDPISEFDYWISHIDPKGIIKHRHFDIRHFVDGWYFANIGVPRQKNLNDFIQSALAYKD